MTRWGDREFRTALAAAVVAGALVLTYAGGQALFAPAPPMLARAARASTIVILVAIHYLVLFAVARGVQGIPARWPLTARVAATGVVAVSGGVLLSFAAFIAFSAIHALCYAAGACAISTLPEQVLHTINVATRYTVLETCVVVPVIVGLAVLRSRVP